MYMMSTKTLHANHGGSSTGQTTNHAYFALSRIGVNIIINLSILTKTL